jgi:hypothetical protein
LRQHDQVGPSRQGDDQLDPAIEGYANLILNGDDDALDKFIKDYNSKHKEDQTKPQYPILQHEQIIWKQGFKTQEYESSYSRQQLGGQEKIEEEEMTKQRVKEGKIALIKDEMERLRKEYEGKRIIDKEYNKIINYYNQRISKLEKMD